jgi:hypothetical protein
MARKLTVPGVLTDVPPGSPGTPPPSPGKPKTPFWLRLPWILTAVVLLLLAVAVLIWAATRPDMRDLTPELLAQAQQQWADAGIESYDVSFQLNASGFTTPSRFEVRVRAGRPIEILRNGRPVSADPESYTIEGLFDIIERELDMSRDPTSPLASVSGKTFLRVRFNDRFGYPEQYLRVTGGTNRSSEMRVDAFRPRRLTGGTPVPHTAPETAP